MQQGAAAMIHEGRNVKKSGNAGVEQEALAMDFGISQLEQKEAP